MSDEKVTWDPGGESPLAHPEYMRLGVSLPNNVANDLFAVFEYS